MDEIKLLGDAIGLAVIVVAIFTAVYVVARRKGMRPFPSHAWIMIAMIFNMIAAITVIVST